MLFTCPCMNYVTARMHASLCARTPRSVSESGTASRTTYIRLPCLAIIMRCTCKPDAIQFGLQMCVQYLLSVISRWWVESMKRMLFVHVQIYASSLYCVHILLGLSNYIIIEVSLNTSTVYYRTSAGRWYIVLYYNYT